MSIMNRRRTCIFPWCNPQSLERPHSRCMYTRAENCQWPFLSRQFCDCRLCRNYLPPSRISAEIPRGCLLGGRYTRSHRWRADRMSCGRCGRSQTVPKTMMATKIILSSLDLDDIQTTGEVRSAVQGSAAQKSIQTCCPHWCSWPQFQVRTTEQWSVLKTVGAICNCPFPVVASFCFVVDPSV